MTSTAVPARARRTQADRRARTREALLEAAARGMSRYGYANLVLEDVASDAGYTRGALYHLFPSKEALALAVVEWVETTWWERMGPVILAANDPLDALVAVAREHAIFCRRDIARVRISLRVEFGGDSHPVGRAVEEATERVIAECARLVTQGRRRGRIPRGAPPRTLARAMIGAVEGLVIELSGQAPYDAVLAERAVRGLLGLPI